MGPYKYPYYPNHNPDPNLNLNPNSILQWGVKVHATVNSDSAVYLH